MACAKFLSFSLLHAFEVASYDPVTKLVAISNPTGPCLPGLNDLYCEPRGPFNGQDDGLFYVTLDEFRNTFFSLSIETTD